jgi:prevent-host-death family protein
VYIFEGGRAMIEVSVKDARSQLSRLLDRIEQGEVVIITRRGKRVAKVVSPKERQRLPNLRALRDSIAVKGSPLSQAVIDARDEEPSSWRIWIRVFWLLITVRNRSARVWNGSFVVWNNRQSAH